ncbi:MAG TPA: lipopolysaccharide heptosyltransferase I [Xanthobacteraceae bacterium]|nr:lipopolysaccharide heptosyltransferase I [Xanthobacteraceae bacterium]
MADILFIKTSSLGDVIHHMPALTEARARRPDARFHWVVEEAYAPLVRLHPAVERVISVAWRRWRHQLHRVQARRELAAFVGELRDRVFDDVIDTQGLIRTGLIARLARGKRHGYDAASIKERAASWLYDVKHAVPRPLHAIERNRLLTARALGYEIAGQADYGLDRRRLAAPGSRYGVLLHATARREKQWPEDHWRALVQMLGREFDLVVPFGTAEERARSERIAAGIARVPDFQPLGEMAKTIAGAAFVVGVDTGLLHLAAALGVPLVALYGHSDPKLTGPCGPGPIKLLCATAGQHHSAADVAAAVREIL